MLQRRQKILIIYKYLDYPLRTTIDEHLYSFLRYANATCYYLKLNHKKDTYYKGDTIPDYLLKIDFDIILFHYAFLSSRYAGKESFLTSLNQVLPLKNSKAIKAVLPQDEYFDSESLVHFIHELNIQIVFSVSPETEWGQLYEGVDFTKIKFYKVLTGYLDDKGIKTIDRFSKSIKKDIDVGYRARNLPQWLGRHGYMKTEIAEIFNATLKKYNLNTSISTNPKDTFLGYDWYRFMVRCKYMLGVEGGSTVHDRDGSITIKGKAYLKEHPNCTFEEIENACFAGLDGKLQLIAISPRHLEACATKTCQLLVESTYNGILKPGVHYIEIKKDFSNVNEVLDLVKNDSLRHEIVENAYRDIVLSGKYSYPNFVNFVLEKCNLETEASVNAKQETKTINKYKYNRYKDWISWRIDFYFHLKDKVSDKWFYIEPTVKLIKYLRLNKPLKIGYQIITGKKSA